MPWLWDQQFALRETWGLPMLHPALPPASTLATTPGCILDRQEHCRGRNRTLCPLQQAFSAPELGEQFIPWSMRFNIHPKPALVSDSLCSCRNYNSQEPAPELLELWQGAQWNTLLSEELFLNIRRLIFFLASFHWFLWYKTQGWTWSKIYTKLAKFWTALADLIALQQLKCGLQSQFP